MFVKHQSQTEEIKSGSSRATLEIPILAALVSFGTMWYNKGGIKQEQVWIHSDSVDTLWSLQPLPSCFSGARSDHIWTGGWSQGGHPDWTRGRALLTLTLTRLVNHKVASSSSIPFFIVYLTLKLVHNLPKEHHDVLKKTWNKQ